MYLDEESSACSITTYVCLSIIADKYLRKYKEHFCLSDNIVPSPKYYLRHQKLSFIMDKINTLGGSGYGFL